MNTARNSRAQPGRSRSLAHVDLAGIALVTASLAVPGAAWASPVSQLSPYGGSALCSGVSPSKVAAIVGHPVPAPTAVVNSSSTMGIISTFTECIYAHITSRRPCSKK